MADRHQIRANWHDYNGGVYFVTICCDSKRHYFGEIYGGEMHLSDIGNIAKLCIGQISSHHRFKVEVWNHVIMPNHIHMVVFIDASENELDCNNNVNVGAIRPPAHGVPCGDNHFNSKLAVVVRTFKAAVSRLYSQNVLSARGGVPSRAQCIAPLRVWQRNYYEHIIRTQRAFDNIMLYIDSNIEKWSNDCFNKI